MPHFYTLEDFKWDNFKLFQKIIKSVKSIVGISPTMV